MSQAEEYEALVERCATTILINQLENIAKRGGFNSGQSRSKSLAIAVLAEIAKAAQEWPTEEMEKLYGSATWRSYVAASPLVRGES